MVWRVPGRTQTYPLLAPAMLCAYVGLSALPAQAEDACDGDVVVQPLLAGGTPHWITPVYDDTVGAPVDLSVATAPEFGWICTGVEFLCNESAQGGHLSGEVGLLPLAAAASLW